MKLSILIPAYNEEPYIQKVLSGIKSTDLSFSGIKEIEIILIDDGSTDRTVEKALEAAPGIKIVRHAKNKGKGAAIISAIPHITGDIMLIQDADLEYSPSLYPGLLKPIIDGYADIVYGSRFLHKGHPENMKMPYFLANLFGTVLINLLNGVHLTDPMTCFKIFKKDVIKGIEFTSKGFGIDAELTSKTARRGFKIKEVAIPYKARTFKEGKKFQPVYSLNVLWAIIKYSIFVK